MNMLIRFKVSNFLSINEMQELSMISSKVRGKREHLSLNRGMNLLRFSAIYGANASGKSNLVTAMDFAQETIIKGLPKDYRSKYNRTLEDNKEKPSYFEFTIKLNKKIFSYGFEVILSNSSITKEWLCVHNANGTKKEIFYRDLIQREYRILNQSKRSNIIDRIRIYFDDIKNLNSELFLYEMNHNKENLYKNGSDIAEYKDVYDWFFYGLDVNYPDRLFSNYSYFMTESNYDEICEMIKSFDFGITKFRIIDTDREGVANIIPSEVLKDVFADIEENIVKANKEGREIEDIGTLMRGNSEFFFFKVEKDETIKIQTIEFEHGNNGIYRLAEESDGTRRMLELMEILFAKNDNKVYVIDEIDRSLHPDLSRHFVERYFECLGQRNVQLIVTTHELRLLDLNLVRRDEIWFIQKDFNGNSELYSLEEFSERFDKKVVRAYLNGRYGAVPNLHGSIKQ